MSGKKFNWKSFISFGLTYAFIILFLTGIILYIAPSGRVAHWVNWEFIGLQKENWQAVHTLFSLLFIILSVFHLFSINWKTFLTYFKARTKNGLNKKKELILSTLLVLVFLLGTLYAVPPFQTIMDWGERFTESWEKKSGNPPVPHAEAYTIKQLSEDILKIPVSKILKILNDNGYQVTDDQKTLQEIGEEYKVPPIEIFKLFNYEPKAGTIEPGGGIGKKTLLEIAEENNISIDDMMKKLNDNNIKAEKTDVFKDIANNNGLAPSDIIVILNSTNDE
jgi:hypothetical protein